MFKFFRKIRQRLFEESRFSKYLLYAIGEIALVMFGILLALQVNNWNEGRKQKAEELVILKALLGEVKSNYGKFQEFYTLKKELRDEWEVFLNHISDLSLPVDQRLSHIRPNNGAFGFNPSESVMSSVLLSGKLDILSNDSLKYELSNWGNVIAEFNQIQSRHVNHVEGAMRNYEFKNRSIEVYSGPGVSWAFDNPFYKNYSSEELKARRHSINEDLEYQNIMLLNNMWLRLIVARSENLDNLFVKLILLIENEIGDR